MDIIRTVSTALQEQLGDELDGLARECGVVQREREFTGRTLLLMIVATLLHKPDATWADFHLTAAQLGLEVTRTAVEKRFAAGQPLVDFFQKALGLALKKSVAAAPSSAGLLQEFTAVLIGDATTIALPDELANLFPGCGGVEGTSRAALKLQVLWDLKTGEIVRLRVESGRSSDARSPIAVTEAAPGSLLVYDLGYFDLSRFAALDRAKAKYISRLQHGTEVYGSEGVKLDLAAHLGGQSSSLVDTAVLLGVSDRLPCRLVAVRVPEEVANRRRQQAREKARKKGPGRVPSAGYLALLAWSLFVTNCSPCHGRVGLGNGIVGQYGLVAIANLHDDRIRTMPDGQIFSTITNGKNTMGAYGPLIAVEDRWAILAYVRALQKSQNVKLADLSADQQKALQSKP